MIAADNLGRLYWRGRGVRQSYHEARRLIGLAAASGNPSSAKNLYNVDVDIQTYAGPPRGFLANCRSLAHPLVCQLPSLLTH